MVTRFPRRFVGVWFLTGDNQSRIKLTEELVGIPTWSEAGKKVDCVTFLRAGGGLHVDAVDGEFSAELRNVANAVVQKQRSHTKDGDFSVLDGVLDAGAAWECCIQPNGKLAIPEAAQIAGRINVKGNRIGVVARIDLIDLVAEDELISQLQKVVKTRPENLTNAVAGRTAISNASGPSS